MASKARIWYSVGCEIHGNLKAKGQHYKELSVACPTSRGAALKHGCPSCKQDAKNNQGE